MDNCIPLSFACLLSIYGRCIQAVPKKLGIFFCTSKYDDVTTRISLNIIHKCGTLANFFLGLAGSREQDVPFL